MDNRPTDLANALNPSRPPAQVGLIAAFNLAALFFLRKNMPKYEALHPTLPPDHATGSSGVGVFPTEAEEIAHVAKHA
jgi:hypothetical protein